MPTFNQGSAVLGGGGGGVASVGGTAPIASSGGANPVISIGAATALVSGSMSAADFAKLLGIGAGANVVAVSATSPATLGGTAQNPSIGVQTFGAAQAGVVPLSGGGAVNFLRADGTWAAPGGASIFRQSVFAGVAVDTTTASGVFVDLLTATITTTAGGILLIHANMSSSNSAVILAPATNSFQVLIDGVVQRGAACAAYTGSAFGASIGLRVAVAAGLRTVKIQWKVSGTTGRIRPVTTTDESASLLVCEVSA